jgi:hypothetical protein
MIWVNITWTDRDTFIIDKETVPNEGTKNIWTSPNGGTRHFATFEDDRQWNEVLAFIDRDVNTLPLLVRQQLKDKMVGRFPLNQFTQRLLRDIQLKTCQKALADSLNEIADDLEYELQEHGSHAECPPFLSNRIAEIHRKFVAWFIKPPANFAERVDLR